MFDAHAHLDRPPEQPSSGPIQGWILPGIDLSTEELARELVATDPRITAALGLHPWHLPETLEELSGLLDSLKALASQRRPCAIGETGLDKGRRGAPMEVQRAAFEAQVELARSLGVPLIIHCVRAHGACLDVLDEAGFTSPNGPGGMVHDFGGPREMIEPWIRAGFYLSVSPRSMGRSSVVASIPGERLLVETDDEGIGRLPEVCATIAAARGVRPSDIASVTESNARRLFGLL